jgi:hypothetical protein
MTIVDSFIPLLQVLFLSMTDPTGRAMVSLVTGWLFAPGRSLADRIRATSGKWHQASYYRVLATARWSVDAVSGRLLTTFLRWCPQETLTLVGDDTFLPRKGRKVFAAGMHRDPCLSTRQRTVKRWGHCWVVLSVVLRSSRDPAHYFCLPLMMRLYVNEATAKKQGRKYRSKTDLMIEMLQLIEQQLPQQKLHFIGDYGYTAPATLGRMPPRIEVTGRVHRRAKLYDPAPSRSRGRGRPRVRGTRLASPEQLLQQRATRQTLQITPHRSYRVRAASLQGCFYQVPDRLVQVVAVEHLRKRRENDVFYTTVLTASCQQIVQWYSQRWAIETTFRDCKQHLAIGAAQNRTRGAVQRTVPTGFLLYTLVVLWHEVRPAHTPAVREYRGKRHPSFSDMLAALRRDTLDQYRKRHLGESPLSSEPINTLTYLENLLALAA